MHDTNPAIGSVWRNWDLHVHTPASLVQQYRSPNPWDDFFGDLRNLPDGYVLGINDYLYVDGYERVLEEYTAGGLPNIAAVFPVIELRLSNFVGTDGHLNRINAHVVFCNTIEPETIRGQFVNGLSAQYKLDPTHDLDLDWRGQPTRQGLREFGNLIRESLHENQKQNLPGDNELLGFHNLVISFDDIRSQLDNTIFHDKALLAIGKTEWADMKWNQQSVATKKDIINSASLIFTAAADLASYHKGRNMLTTAGVNNRLIDCSDAHTFSTSSEKDRLGNCMTWINADPTFEGLRHAVTEFDDRIFVGHRPPKIDAIHLRPDQHMSSVTIRRRAEHKDVGHKYFDISLPLNPGFVAVVGNKGTGKSALLDVVGLTSGSRNESHFTFLNKERFRHPINNPAKNYKATLGWLSGSTSSRELDSSISEDDPERCTYLPQQLIDTICSTDPGDDSTKRFDTELGKVLFAHVPKSDRLGSSDLGSLIGIRTTEFERRLRLLRGELALLNSVIVDQEKRSRPERRRQLEAQLKLQHQQLSAHIAGRPPDPQQPPAVAEDPALAAVSQELEKLREKRREVDTERINLEKQLLELGELSEIASQLLNSLETLERQLDEFDRTNRPRAERLRLDLDQIVTRRLNSTTLESKSERLNVERSRVKQMIEGSDEKSIPSRLGCLDREISDLDNQLRVPFREYTESVKAMQAWKTTRQRLGIGSVDEPGVQILESQLKELDDIPNTLLQLRNERSIKVREIHRELSNIVRVYMDLYQPALDFIRTHPVATRAHVEFGVGLQERHLDTLFWDIYNRRISGSFQGIESGSELLSDFIEKTDFDDEEAVVRFVEELDEAIHQDVRGARRGRVDPFRAIRKGYALNDLYDRVFGLEYLGPVYSLEYSGTPIDRLSPGQKGTLLLMFYLLVDRSRHPILLDQPDENLDNQTIKELLVPAIKEAKQRRQIVIVTHNPNVAVVADADQIIVARFDGSRFRYESGSIERLPINKKIVDVLEGTLPAFKNRSAKYQES